MIVRAFLLGFCPSCAAVPILLARPGPNSFLAQERRVKEDGLCPDCHKPLPGLWGKSSGHDDRRVRPIF